MKYHVITLGCQMNLSDSERVISVLDDAGYEWTDNENEAGLIGILACSVRQKAIDKVYSRIYKWNKWKNNKNLITFISGCILPSDHEKFLKLFDITFQMKDFIISNNIWISISFKFSTFCSLIFQICILNKINYVPT